jgi:hypothetical protein
VYSATKPAKKTSRYPFSDVLRDFWRVCRSCAHEFVHILKRNILAARGAQVSRLSRHGFTGRNIIRAAIRFFISSGCLKYNTVLHGPGCRAVFPA